MINLTNHKAYIIVIKIDNIRYFNPTTIDSPYNSENFSDEFPQLATYNKNSSFLVKLKYSV